MGTRECTLGKTKGGNKWLLLLLGDNRSGKLGKKEKKSSKSSRLSDEQTEMPRFIL